MTLSGVLPSNICICKLFRQFNMLLLLLLLASN